MMHSFSARGFPCDFWTSIVIYLLPLILVVLGFLLVIELVQINTPMFNSTMQITPKLKCFLSTAPHSNFPFPSKPSIKVRTFVCLSLHCLQVVFCQLQTTPCCDFTSTQSMIVWLNICKRKQFEFMFIACKCVRWLKSSRQALNVPWIV